MLEIKNYSFEYFEGKKVVKNINLFVKEGDIYAFCGRNGAGKSTTLKSIVGINHITEGDILLDQVSIKENEIEFKKNIAYIPDNPILYEHLTGIQYLDFVADMFDMTEKARQEAIEKYAKKFMLYDNLGDIISSYSHGMKQKLAIISALIRKPKLLVLDEPFVGLDPKAAYDVKEIMKKMCEEGASIFFSTHVLEVAEKLCDKIAIIKNGEIVAFGKTEEVKGDNSLEDVFLELANNE